MRELNITTRPGSGVDLAEFLEGPAATAGALDALNIFLCISCFDSHERMARRVLTALRPLSGPRHLNVAWCDLGRDDEHGLFEEALTFLTSLSSLRVSSASLEGQPSRQLGLRPDLLRQLSLSGTGTYRRGCSWGVDALHAAPSWAR